MSLVINARIVDKDLQASKLLFKNKEIKFSSVINVNVSWLNIFIWFNFSLNIIIFMSRNLNFFT